MKQIKKLKSGDLSVDGVLYTLYKVSDLPMSFGFKQSASQSGNGTAEWFNYKGLTYVIKK